MEVAVVDRDGCASFSLRVTPRARQSAVGGVLDGVLVVRIAAPPVEGKANAAVRRFLADLLGVRESAVAISSGEKSRNKSVTVRGKTAAEIRQRLSGISVDKRESACRQLQEDVN